MKRVILFAFIPLVIVAVSWQVFTSKRPAETESPTVAIVKPVAKAPSTEMLADLLKKELLKEEAGTTSELESIERRKAIIVELFRRELLKEEQAGSSLSESELENSKRRKDALAELFKRELLKEKNLARPKSPVKRFETVEDYFKDGNPNPISHRLGLPRYERKVSKSTKQKVKNRDGNCCLVCGSTIDLEVDHRIALMNGGDNEIDNLGTLCDDCHNKKTRLDYRIRKQREKVASRR